MNPHVLRITLVLLTTDLCFGNILGGSVYGIHGMNTTFTTTIEPTSVPFLSVSWTVNGSSIITSTHGNDFVDPKYVDRINLYGDTGSLELRNLNNDDTGEYAVVILRASLGHLMMGRTELEVHPKIPPPTLNCPTSIEGRGHVELFCDDGDTGLAKQWTRDGKPLVASDRIEFLRNNSVLMVKDVNRMDSGEYSCNVSNTHDHGVSTCNLTVYYGPDTPTVHQQPNPAVEEEPVTLSCASASLPAAMLIWEFKESLVPGPDYVIAELDEEHLGDYSCTASNALTGMVVSTVYTLNAKISPPTLNCPTSIEGRGHVELFCDDGDTGLAKQWTRDGKPLVASDRIEFLRNNSMLIVKDVNRMDSGDYSCNVSNTHDHGVSTCKLTVYYGPDTPTVHQQPNPAVEEEPVTLSCASASLPAAMLIWEFKGSLLHGPDYVIAKLDEEHLGDYSCTASNALTEVVVSTVYTLNDKIPPPTLNCSTSIEGRGHVKLFCDDGDTGMAKQWTRDGKPLVASDRIEFQRNNSVLMVKDVNRMDSGEYSCNVSNTHDHGVSTCNLTVYYGPDTPTVHQQPNPAVEEEPVTLSCASASLPAATLTWVFNGSVVPGPDYAIAKLDEDLLGDYNCTASNAFTGMVVSTVYTLNATSGCGVPASGPLSLLMVLTLVGLFQQ